MASKRPFKSTSKRGAGLPRKAQDLSKEELLLTLQKKKECNARALKIVEGMLETDVKEDWFLDVLQHINQNHFQDIIEERSITRLCGYPLCSNELKNVPSQQYRISTKLNKVYDIKERKNFCSNKCFKASKFIKDQMHTSPLWLRDIEPVMKFTLIPSTEASGGAGDEVNVQIERVSKEEVKQLSGDDGLKAGSSHPTLADLLSGLHIVTSLQGNASPSHDTENFSQTDSGEEKASETNIVDVMTIEGIEKIKRVETCLENTGNSTNTSEDSACSPQMEISNDFTVTTGTRESRVVTEGNSSTFQVPEEKLCQKPRIAEKISCDSPLLEKPSPPPAGVVDSSAGVTKSTNVKVQTSVNCPVSDVELRQDDENLNSNEACCKLSSESENQAKEVMLNSVGPKRPKRKIQSNSTSPTVTHVEKCAEEWFTMETMCFLFGESALRDMLEQKGESIQAHYKALRTATWDQEKHERFYAICKRLNILELEDNNFESQMTSDEARRRPLPDYDALKKEAESMELKIKAFYKGKIEQESKVTFAEDTKLAPTNSDKTVEQQIPLVHQHSQRALRKKIVLDGLNRVLPDFFRTFGMRPSEMTTSVRGLISTFALSSTNITFKPHEWSLLGLIVIKLLSLREPELKQCLEREQTNTYLTLMLMSYKQEAGYLDRLLSWLTDVDKLLARPQPS